MNTNVTHTNRRNAGAQRPHSPGKRLLAALLSAGLAFEAAAAPFTEENFWSARHRTVAAMNGRQGGDALAWRSAPVPAPASLPTVFRGGGPAVSSERGRWETAAAPFGEVRRYHAASSPDRPLVIHIQDVHDDETAQRSIEGLVKRLVDGGQTRLVGVEGAAGAFRLAPYRGFPDRATILGVSDWLLEKNLIAGPERAAWTSERPAVLWGVETPNLYLANVRAFRRGDAAAPAVRRRLTAWSARVQVLKGRLFPQEVLTWDRLDAEHAAGRGALAAYAEFLAEKAPRGRFPQLDRFLSAARLSDAVDLPTAEVERNTLLRELSSRLPAESLAALAARAAESRAGVVSEASFRQEIFALARRSGLRPEDYPHLSAHARALSAAESVDAAAFLEEIERARGEVWERLAPSGRVRELHRLDQVLARLRRLTDFSSTPRDWRGSADADVAALSEGLDRLSREEGLSGVASFRDPAALAPYEEFSRAALRRNASMVDNLLAKMAAEKAPSAVLVAGGFHTEGMEELLRDRDISFLTITPRIGSSVEPGFNALKPLLPGRSPLQDIFIPTRDTLKTPFFPSANKPLLGGQWAFPSVCVLLAAGALALQQDGRLSEENRAAVLALAGPRRATVELREGAPGRFEVYETVEGRPFFFEASVSPAADGPAASGTLFDRSVGDSRIALSLPGRASAGPFLALGTWASGRAPAVHAALSGPGRSAAELLPAASSFAWTALAPGAWADVQGVFTSLRKTLSDLPAVVAGTAFLLGVLAARQWLPLLERVGRRALGRAAQFFRRAAGEFAPRAWLWPGFMVLPAGIFLAVTALVHKPFWPWIKAHLLPEAVETCWIRQVWPHAPVWTNAVAVVLLVFAGPPIVLKVASVVFRRPLRALVKGWPDWSLIARSPSRRLAESKDADPRLDALRRWEALIGDPGAWRDGDAAAAAAEAARILTEEIDVPSSQFQLEWLSSYDHGKMMRVRDVLQKALSLILKTEDRITASRGLSSDERAPALTVLKQRYQDFRIALDNLDQTSYLQHWPLYIFGPASRWRDGIESFVRYMNGFGFLYLRVKARLFVNLSRGMTDAGEREALRERIDRLMTESIAKQHEREPLNGVEFLSRSFRQVHWRAAVHMGGIFTAMSVAGAFNLSAWNFWVISVAIVYFEDAVRGMFASAQSRATVRRQVIVRQSEPEVLPASETPVEAPSDETPAVLPVEEAAPEEAFDAAEQSLFARLSGYGHWLENGEESIPAEEEGLAQALKVLRWERREAVLSAARRDAGAAAEGFFQRTAEEINGEAMIKNTQEELRILTRMRELAGAIDELKASLDAPVGGPRGEERAHVVEEHDFLVRRYNEAADAIRDARNAVGIPSDDILHKKPLGAVPEPRMRVVLGGLVGVLLLAGPALVLSGPASFTSSGGSLHPISLFLTVVVLGAAVWKARPGKEAPLRGEGGRFQDVRVEDFARSLGAAERSIIVDNRPAEEVAAQGSLAPAYGGRVSYRRVPLKRVDDKNDPAYGAALIGFVERLRVALLEVGAAPAEDLFFLCRTGNRTTNVIPDAVSALEDREGGPREGLYGSLTPGIYGLARALLAEPSGETARSLRTLNPIVGPAFFDDPKLDHQRLRLQGFREDRLPESLVRWLKDPQAKLAEVPEDVRKAWLLPQYRFFLGDGDPVGLRVFQLKANGRISHVLVSDGQATVIDPLSDAARAQALIDAQGARLLRTIEAGRAGSETLPLGAGFSLRPVALPGGGAVLLLDGPGSGASQFVFSGDALLDRPGTLAEGAVLFPRNAEGAPGDGGFHYALLDQQKKDADARTRREKSAAPARLVLSATAPRLPALAPGRGLGRTSSPRRKEGFHEGLKLLLRVTGEDSFSEADLVRVYQRFLSDPAARILLQGLSARFGEDLFAVEVRLTKDAALDHTFAPTLVGGHAFADKVVLHLDPASAREEFLPGSPVEEAFDVKDVFLSVLEWYANVHRGKGANSYVISRRLEAARHKALLGLGVPASAWDKHLDVFDNQRISDQIKAKALSQGAAVLERRSDESGLDLGVGVLAFRKEDVREDLTQAPVHGGGTVEGVTEADVQFAHRHSHDLYEPGTPASVLDVLFAEVLARAAPGAPLVPVDPSLKAEDVAGLDPSLEGLSSAEALRRFRETFLGRGQDAVGADGVTREHLFFDTAASSLTSRWIADAFFRALSLPAEERARAVALAAKAITEFLGASTESFDVVPTQNTSEAVHIAMEAASAYAAAHGETPVVVTTGAEHTALSVTPQVDGRARVALAVDEQGFIDPDELERVLRRYNGDGAEGDGRVRLVALTGASNVAGTGVLTRGPDYIRRIADIAHRYGAELLVDAAQAIAHRSIRLEAAGIDHLVFSGHKVFNPWGVGALVSRRESILGGAIADWKRRLPDSQVPVAGLAAVAYTFRLLEKIGMEEVSRQEEVLTEHFLTELGRIPGLTVIGPREPGSAATREGVVVFNLDGVPNALAAAALAQLGISLRSGCFCQHIYVSSLLARHGVNDWGALRISFGVYTTRGEVDELLARIRQAVARKEALAPPVPVRLEIEGGAAHPGLIQAVRKDLSGPAGLKLLAGLAAAAEVGLLKIHFTDEAGTLHREEGSHSHPGEKVLELWIDPAHPRGGLDFALRLAGLARRAMENRKTDKFFAERLPHGTTCNSGNALKAYLGKQGVDLSSYEAHYPIEAAAPGKDLWDWDRGALPEGTRFLQLQETDGTLSYVVVSEGEAAVFDPTLNEAGRLADALEENGARSVLSFETHTHADHPQGSTALRSLYGRGEVKVVASEGSSARGADVYAAEGRVFKVGALKIETLHTPGHTADANAYVLRDGATDQVIAVVTGDTWAGARVDLGGDAAQLHASVSRLHNLPPETLLLPGHRADRSEGFHATTVREERKSLTEDRDAFVRAKAEEPNSPIPHVEEILAFNRELSSFQAAPALGSAWIRAAAAKLFRRLGGAVLVAVGLGLASLLGASPAKADVFPAPSPAVVLHALQSGAAPAAARTPWTDAPLKVVVASRDSWPAVAALAAEARAGRGWLALALPADPALREKAAAVVQRSEGRAFVLEEPLARGDALRVATVEGIVRRSSRARSIPAYNGRWGLAVPLGAALDWDGADRALWSRWVMVLGAGPLLRDAGDRLQRAVQIFHLLSVMA